MSVLLYTAQSLVRRLLSLSLGPGGRLEFAVKAGSGRKISCAIVAWTERTDVILLSTTLIYGQFLTLLNSRGAEANNDTTHNDTAHLPIEHSF